MAFDLSTLPAPVQLAFKITAPSLWSTVVFGAIACGVKNPNDLADLAFHLHHPELSGRSIKSSEKGLIAEWNSYYTFIKRALSGAPPPKTIPTAPPPDGGGGVIQTYTQDDLVDAAIAKLKVTNHLTFSQEAMYRGLFKEITKKQGHGPGLIGRAMPTSELQRWFDNVLLFHKVCTVCINVPLWGAGTALATAAIAMSAVSVVFMVIGFGFALNKAMNSVYRCYGCYGQAYRIVAWAYEGFVPSKSQHVLNNANHPMYGEAPDRARMDQAWREGQRVASTGIDQTISNIASKAGVSKADAALALKTFMRLKNRTALAKDVMWRIAIDTEGHDAQVANAIAYQAKSKAWSYPN